MDGARFANAVAFLGCHPGDITWRAGVDVLSFGATKNGALAAEAVVFFDTTLVRDFELRRKRAGHLFSKSRYIAAQLLTYLESGLWRRNAERTNALAQRLAQAAAPHLLHPVEGNELFLRLGVERRGSCARRASSSTTGARRTAAKRAWWSPGISRPRTSTRCARRSRGSPRARAGSSSPACAPRGPRAASRRSCR